VCDVPESRCGRHGRARVRPLPSPRETVGALLLKRLLPLLADGLGKELGFNFSMVKVGDLDAMGLSELCDGGELRS